MSATTDAPLPDTDYGQHPRQSGQILSLRRREAPVAAGTGSSRATVPCRCRRVLDLGCVPSQIAKNTAVIIRNRPNTPLVPWRTSVDPPHLLREDANFLDREIAANVGNGYAPPHSHAAFYDPDKTQRVTSILYRRAEVQG